MSDFTNEEIVNIEQLNSELTKNGASLWTSADFNFTLEVSENVTELKLLLKCFEKNEEINSIDIVDMGICKVKQETKKDGFVDQEYTLSTATLGDLFNLKDDVFFRFGVNATYLHKVGNEKGTRVVLSNEFGIRSGDILTGDSTVFLPPSEGSKKVKAPKKKVDSIEGSELPLNLSPSLPVIFGQEGIQIVENNPIITPQTDLGIAPIATTHNMVLTTSSINIANVIRGENFINSFKVDFFRANHKESSKVKVKNEVLVVRMRKHRNTPDLSSKQIRFSFGLSKVGEFKDVKTLQQTFNERTSSLVVEQPTIFVRFDKVEYQKVTTEEANSWKESTIKNFMKYLKNPQLKDSDEKITGSQQEITFSYKLIYSQKKMCDNTRRNICRVSLSLFFIYPQDDENVVNPKSKKVVVQMKYVYDSKRKETNMVMKDYLQIEINRDNNQLVGDLKCLMFSNLIAL